jgi:hypothetical protein
MGTYHLLLNRFFLITDLKEYIEKNPKVAEHFTYFMGTLHNHTALVIPFEFDFGRVKSLVDTGGGQGK